MSFTQIRIHSHETLDTLPLSTVTIIAVTLSRKSSPQTTERRRRRRRKNTDHHSSTVFGLCIFHAVTVCASVCLCFTIAAHINIVQVVLVVLDEMTMKKKSIVSILLVISYDVYCTVYSVHYTLYTGFHIP